MEEGGRLLCPWMRQWAFSDNPGAPKTVRVGWHRQDAGAGIFESPPPSSAPI